MPVKLKATADEMLALRKKGMLNKHIAELLGVSEITVYRRIGRNPNSQAKPRRKPEETKVEPTKIEEKPANSPKKLKNIAAITTNLLDFAFFPVINERLYTLSKLAAPEPWKFKDPSLNRADNPETTILEAYLHETFRRRATEYNTCPAEDRDKIFLIRNNLCCFHTGLYTSSGKNIYALFERNHRVDARQEWYFKTFDEENSSLFKYIHPLPLPDRDVEKVIKAFNPTKDCRINLGHCLQNPVNVERLPSIVREYWNGQLLLETAIELAKRQALVDPSVAFNLSQSGKLEFLLPLYFTNPNTPDLVAVFDDMGDYYHIRTLLTPRMAYFRARSSGRINTNWLRAFVE